MYLFRENGQALAQSIEGTDWTSVVVTGGMEEGGREGHKEREAWMDYWKERGRERDRKDEGAMDEERIKEKGREGGRKLEMKDGRVSQHLTFEAFHRCPSS